MHLRLHFRRCQERLRGFVALSPGRQNVVLLAGQARSPALHVKVTAREGDLLYYQISLHLYSFDPSQGGGELVSFGFTPGKQQEQKAPCRMSQMTVRTRYSPWVLTCTSWVQSNDCLDEKLDIFLLTKAVSAETSFLPGIVHAVWETSLKQIGKRLLLFCQYKPCLH